MSVFGKYLALLAVTALLVAESARAANWTISLGTPGQTVPIGATATYDGTITNTTGAPLALDAALDFTTSPHLEQFDIDFADEILALDLVIPSTGYTGPLFKVTWLGAAVPGSYGLGTLTLSSDTPADPLTQIAAFTLGSPGTGTFCNTGTGDSGGNTAIAYDDSTGQPVIAFNDPVAGTLRFASFNGTSWSSTTIASTIGGQAAPALALDLDLHPHIVFYDAVAGDLKHAWRPIASWQTETIESAGNVGMEPSLVVDGAGDLHVSYFDITNGDLHYARRSGASWTTSVVDTTGSVGRYSSVIADADQVPSISYYDATARDLKFARRNGSGWQTEIVDGVGLKGTWTSLRPSGAAFAISYRDATPGSRGLRFATGTPGNWTTELVDDTGNPGLGTALELNAFGQPRIAYLDSLSASVRFATRTGASWSHQDVASRGSSRVSLARSGTDQPLLSFADRVSGEIRFASIGDCGTTDAPSPGPTRDVALMLEPSRPNPFRESTTIGFTLAEAAVVRLRIFDTAGRCVAEPFSGSVSAGRHEVVWSGASRTGVRLAPGRYLYEIRAGNEVRVGRLVRLR